jgi:hypothetical protein
VIAPPLGVSNAKRSEIARRNSGLGGILRRDRSTHKAGLAPDNLSGNLDLDEDELRSRSRVMSASQIVGDEPISKSPNPKQAKGMNLGKTLSSSESVGPITKKKGGMFEWLENRRKETEDYERNKAEKMQEIHMKRVMEKQKEQEMKNKGK